MMSLFALGIMRFSHFRPRFRGLKDSGAGGVRNAVHQRLSPVPIKTPESLERTRPALNGPLGQPAAFGTMFPNTLQMNRPASASEDPQ